MYIHWDKKLELGNDLIDTQHRMLILLCRKLDIAIKSNVDKKGILRVMLEVKKFSEFHLPENTIMLNLLTTRLQILLKFEFHCHKAVMQENV